MSQRIERHVSAVAPSPPSQAVAVQLRKFFQGLVQGGELVLEFSLAKIMHQHGSEFSSARSHAAIVHHQDGNAVSHENLIEQRSYTGPSVADFLAMRTTVRIHEQWDLLPLADMREVQQAMQHSAIVGMKIDKFRRRQFIGVDAFGLPEGIARAAYAAK